MTSSPDTPATLLAEAVATWADRFASDRHISGADIVEWIVEWLPRAAAALDQAKRDAQPDPS